MAEPTPQSSNDVNEQPPRRRGNGRRKWYLLGLAVFFLAIALAYGLYYFLVAQYYASTQDAYVHGNRVMLTPQRAGTVTAIHAEDTDFVRAGDTVVELDDTDVNNRLDQAGAKLAATVRRVHQMFAQAAEQGETIKLRQTELDQAERDYGRDRRLIKVHGVTEKAFEHSRSAYQRAQSQLAAAQHRLTELEAQTEGTSVRNHPQVQQAAADLRAAYLDVRRSQVPAPVTGYIAQRDVQLGQKVDPSQPMLSIVPMTQTWVSANFKETDLTSMRIGQPAHVTADFYGDDVVYHGHVAGISPGTGAAFELLPPQNASGNWIKIVRRVPVRIELDPKELKKHPLRLGLSMQVSVDLHDTSGKMLATETSDKTPLATNVYRQRKDGAQRMINQVIDANDGDPETGNRSNVNANIGRLSPPS